MSVFLHILFSVLIFPGFASLMLFALLAEWFDRKLYARLQGRVGPQYTGTAGILQPLADFIKLLAKEDITPRQASRFMFNVVPLVSFAAVCTAAMLLPIGYLTTTNSFPGDLLVALYLLGVPTLATFLAGWHSSNFFGAFGGVRAITQLFSYEVPFLLSLLTPALLAGTWQIREINSIEILNPLYGFIHALAFVVAIIGLQAKLERVPFDVPEAETEIVGGAFTEYSGRKLALFHLSRDLTLWVGSALIAAIFLGGYGSGWWALIGYILKTFAVVTILSFIRAGAARMRIDQVVDFSWKFLAPLSFLQLLLVIILKAYQLV
jgi:NADH-quinone oxidoreductase subunit H